MKDRRARHLNIVMYKIFSDGPMFVQDFEYIGVARGNVCM